jgi:hypothetical protein
LFSTSAGERFGAGRLFGRDEAKKVKVTKILGIMTVCRHCFWTFAGLSEKLV